MEDMNHFDKEGRARMVDVSSKQDTTRQAIAKGSIMMKPETFARIIDQNMAKGNVLGVARVAGIMATKQTSHLIPMCHPLMLTGVDVYFHTIAEKSEIEIECHVRTTGKTGVEMEALTGVSAAALTIYDMCKAIDRGMVIKDIRLMEKSGGKSGLYKREED